MKVYVFCLEDVYNDFDTREIEVFATKGEAIKRYEDALAEKKKEIDFDAAEDLTIEETNEESEQDVRMFHAYEEGYYTQNHLFIYVQEQELKK